MTSPVHTAVVVGDVAAGVTVIGTLAGYLPDVAAVFAIIYYITHIWVIWRQRDK